MPKASRDLATFEKRLRALENIKVATKPISTAQIDKAALAAQRLQQQQQRLSIAAQELANRQERARQAADRLAKSQERLAQQSTKASKGLGANADAHVKAFRAIETGAKRNKAEVDKINADTARQAKEQARIQEQSAKVIARVQTTTAKAGANALIDSLKRSGKAGFDLDRILNRVGSTLSRIGSGLSSFGRNLSVALTAPLAALGAISVKSASNLDDQVNTLKAFTGSAEAAEKRLAELIATAQKTPGLTTSLGLVLDSQLRVAEVTVQTIDKILPAIGKLNAVSRLQDPQRFAQNMVQLVTQNFERIDLKELVGQSPLAGQIIKELFNVDSPTNAEAIRESAKKMGITTTDAFFAAFAEAAGRNQALATITESISSRFGKAVDRVMIALRPLGLAIINAITPGINALIPFIEKLGKAFSDLPKPAQQAILVIGGLAALLGPALLVIGGIVTSLGGLVTGIAAVAGVVGSIGFPAVLAILAGLAVQISALVAIAATLFRAWQTNFLGIRQLVSDAANAVRQAFGRIREVFEEITTRVLPTLQSISTKIINTVTALWQKYGATVVSVISTSFQIVTRTLEAFIRFFGNVVDLVAKLIDGDWRGAWRAFSRIIINALDSLSEFFDKALRVVARGFLTLNAFLLRQAVRFVQAGSEIAAKVVIGIAAGLIAGAPKVSDAIAQMMLLAAVDFAAGPAGGLIAGAVLAAMRRAAAEGVSVPVTTEEQGLARIRLNPDGSLKTTKKPPPAGTGGSGDKKAANALRKAQDDFAKAQLEFEKTQAANRLALARSATQQQFELTKDGLDRELSQLESNFEDRVISVRKYFDERKRVQEAEIDAELTKEKALSGSLADEWSERRKQIKQEFDATIAEINRDPGLKGRSREISIQTAAKKEQTDLAKAQNDFETQNAEISTRILLLQRKRKDVAAELTRQEKELLKQIQRQESELRAELFEAQGQTASAATIQLRQRFKDSLDGLRVDISSLPPELQKALDSVDIKTLKSRLAELPEPVRDLIALLEIAAARAVITEQSADIDRTLTELRLKENEIQNKVLDGVLSERDARAQIVGLQQIAGVRLKDILAAQLAIAKAAGQQDEVLRIQGQIQEIERLGKVVDDVAVQINRSLADNIESGFANVFDSALEGFDGLMDAARSFGRSFLSILNQLAARKLTQDLFGDLLKPSADTGTQGTAGGFLSKLFGLGPKAADTSVAAATATALTTAGTATATALTTGGTAAATALTTGGASAGTTLLSSITAAATAFAATVSAAGAAFAAAVGAASSSQAIGGLGASIPGAAKGSIFTPKPGGQLAVVAEGGYPEAVLTTDPKYAARQYEILKHYLKHTRGLFGRIPQQIIPRLETGAFISPRQTEMNLLSSITRGPSPLSVLPETTLANAGASRKRNMRFIFVDNERDARNWWNSAEGDEVFQEKIARHAALIRRL